MSKILLKSLLIILYYNINGKIITNMCGNINKNESPTKLSDCINGHNDYRGKCCLITFYKISNDNNNNETNYPIINRNCISVNELSERETNLIDYIAKKNLMKINIECFGNLIYINFYILLLIILIL